MYNSLPIFYFGSENYGSDETVFEFHSSAMRRKSVKPGSFMGNLQRKG